MIINLFVEGHEVGPLSNNSSLMPKLEDPSSWDAALHPTEALLGVFVNSFRFRLG